MRRASWAGLLISETDSGMKHRFDGFEISDEVAGGKLWIVFHCERHCIRRSQCKAAAPNPQSGLICTTQDDERLLVLGPDGAWKPAKHPLHYDKPEKAGVWAMATAGPIDKQKKVLAFFMAVDA